MKRNLSYITKKVTFYDEGSLSDKNDWVAVESTLDILVKNKKKFQILRTPGHEKELATGLCFTKGIFTEPKEIKRVEKTGIDTVEIELSCQKKRVIKTKTYKISSYIDPEMIFKARDEFSRRQKVFKKTGALHACAFFDQNGKILVFFEDVGRHNAVDKCVGGLILGKRIDRAFLCLVSSRIGGEIVRKIVSTGVPVAAGVSAPTDMAIDTAQKHGVTLIGFLRDKKFNVYSGKGRIRFFKP